jgi:gas vesicle protein
MTVKNIIDKDVPALFLGGLVGAGLALMLAPRSGKETRRKIEELAVDLKDKGFDYVNQTRGKAAAAVENGRDFFKEKKSLITTAIEAGRDAYTKERARHH